MAVTFCTATWLATSSDVRDTLPATWGLSKMNLVICLRCSQGTMQHACGEDSIQTHDSQ